MKKQIILLLVVLLSVPAFAQNQDHKRNGGKERGQMNDEKRKEIEAQRVAYITTQLDLTAEESKAFWPVYNEYQKTVNQHRETKGDFKKPLKDISELTDAEVDELLKAKFAYEQESLEIEEVYYGRFKQVLPIKKVAAFYEAERGFKKELLKSLRSSGTRPGDKGEQHQKGERIAAPEK